LGGTYDAASGVPGIGISAVDSESVTRWVPGTAPSPDVKVDNVNEPLASVVAEADRPLVGVKVTLTEPSGRPSACKTPDAGAVGARPVGPQPAVTVASINEGRMVARVIERAVVLRIMVAWPCLVLGANAPPEPFERAHECVR